MDIDFIEKESTKIKFIVTGESHEVLNLIRKELFEDSSVDFAGYKIDHPLTKKAIFTVSTKRKSPKKAISDAIDRIKKKLSDFETETKKI